MRHRLSKARSASLRVVFAFATISQSAVRGTRQLPKAPEALLPTFPDMMPSASAPCTALERKLGKQHHSSFGDSFAPPNLFEQLDDRFRVSTTRFSAAPYRQRLAPRRRPPIPDGLAAELRQWKLECKEPSCGSSQCKSEAHKKSSPDDPMFPNADGGFLDPANFRYRVLRPLREALELPTLNFQVLRRTIATRAQKLGSVKDVQSHLRHSRADTTANEYMQELPESVQQMVGTVYAMLTSTATKQQQAG